MNFASLRDFLLTKMSMSHIYQPVLIRALIDSGGSATLRQLAHEFLKQDESELIYYERRIREMPTKVLRKHGIITQDGNLISLRVHRMTLQQKAELRKICDQKLQDFIVRNGISIWDYRLIDNKCINDDLRFRVLKEAKGRCALCGASAQITESASRGGDYLNCYPQHASKARQMSNMSLWRSDLEESGTGD